MGICQIVVFSGALLYALRQPGSWRERFSHPLSAICVGLIAVLLAVDLIGMNRGEVIRLWIFLACFFQIPVAYVCSRLGQSMGFGACRGRHGPSNCHRPQYDQLRHPVKFRYWLIAIVVLAAALRFVPIWFGLPFAQARPDETAALGLAVSVRSRDLNPHFFHWPSLALYLFAAVHTVLSWVRAAAGGTSALTFADLMISARAVVATAGTLTVVVVFVMARRMGGPVLGLLSAFFLAVSILHVRDSHFAMTDVLMTFLATTSLMLLLRALDATERDRVKPIAWFALSGLVAGLATSTKYNAGALVAAMAGAQIWLLAHRRSLAVADAILAAVAGIRAVPQPSDSLPGRPTRYSTTGPSQPTCCST